MSAHPWKRETAPDLSVTRRTAREQALPDLWRSGTTLDPLDREVRLEHRLRPEEARSERAAYADARRTEEAWDG